MSQDLVNKKMVESIMAAIAETALIENKQNRTPEEVIKRYLTRRPLPNEDDDTLDLYVLTKQAQSAEKALRAAGVEVVKSYKENSVESIITVK